VIPEFLGGSLCMKDVCRACNNRPADASRIVNEYINVNHRIYFFKVSFSASAGIRSASMRPFESISQFDGM